MPIRRAVVWLSLSVVGTPLLWGIFGAILAVLSNPIGQNLAERFALNLLILPLYGAVVVLMLTPIYAALISFWVLLARVNPVVEADRRRLAVSCAILAFPGASIVGASFANVVGTFDWREFSFAFSLALTSGSIGLLLPRLAIKSLAPGAFSGADVPHAA